MNNKRRCDSRDNEGHRFPAHKKRRNESRPRRHESRRRCDYSNDCNNRRRQRSQSSRRRPRQRSKSPSASRDSSGDDDAGHFEAAEGLSIKNRYVIEQELGKGTFGKVFRCRDSKHADTVAVKVVRAVKRYIESAEIEADICDDIYDKQKRAGASLCVKMYAHFHFRDHYVMVFEPLGPSLYDLVKKNDYKRFPLEVVRHVSFQLLQGIDFLRSINLIHTDLKLENILFVQGPLEKRTVYHKDKSYEVDVPVDTRIKLIDFGGATYDDDRDKSTIVNTRQYRGPEVTLEVGWSFPSDIWSAACIIAEIYCGDLLFQTHEELEHLALIEKVCGRFPDRMVRRSKYRNTYFHRNGDVRVQDLPREGKRFLEKFPLLDEYFSLSEDDRASGILELEKKLLQIDPQERWSAKEAIEKSSFFDELRKQS